MNSEVYFFKDDNIFIKGKKEARKLNKKEIDELMKKIKSKKHKNLKGSNFVTFSNNEETIRFFGEKEFKDFYKNWKKQKNIKKGTVGVVIGVGALAAALIFNSYTKDNKKTLSNEEPIITGLPKPSPYGDNKENLEEIKKTLYKLGVNLTKRTKEETINIINEIEGKSSEEKENITNICVDFVPSTDKEIDDNAKTYDYLLDEICPRYGISPNIIRAIMCQESCGGKLNNIFKIDAEEWLDQVVTVENVEGKKVSFVITYNKEIYHDIDFVVNPEDLDISAIKENEEKNESIEDNNEIKKQIEIETEKKIRININLACIIFLHDFKLSNCNIEDAIFLHNIGSGNYENYRELFPEGNIDPKKVFKIIITKVGYDDAGDYGDPNYVFNVYSKNFPKENEKNSDPFVVNYKGTRYVLNMESTGIDGRFDRDKYYDENDDTYRNEYNREWLGSLTK